MQHRYGVDFAYGFDVGMSCGLSNSRRSRIIQLNPINRPAHAAYSMVALSPVNGVTSANNSATVSTNQRSGYDFTHISPNDFNQSVANLVNAGELTSEAGAELMRFARPGQTAVQAATEMNTPENKQAVWLLFSAERGDISSQDELGYLFQYGSIWPR